MLQLINRTKLVKVQDKFYIDKNLAILDVLYV